MNDLQDAGLAKTPEPPYLAVIFASRRRAGDNGDGGYDEMAARMAVLSRSMPGFVGMDSARDADGTGLTVCCWRSESDIAAWKWQAEHLQAQRLGHAKWYTDFELRVARVERAYGMS